MEAGGWAGAGGLEGGPGSLAACSASLGAASPGSGPSKVAFGEE